MTTSHTTQAQPNDIFIDFATPLTRDIVKQARAAGVKGFMQYVRYDDADRAKYGSRAEAELVFSEGGYYMMNWEIQADRALGGYMVGRSDGARSRGWLRTIGYPEDVSAPVSVDTNTTYGNKDSVYGFCKGHWETDGDFCDNIGYLDTDGGRALADLNPRVWIPGAFGWSPELLSYNEFLKKQGFSQSQRNWAVAAKAKENPMACAIQFPSEAAYGIRVDHNVVLQPFNVWCAEYTVNNNHGDVVDPPTNQQGDKDMAFIIHHQDNGWLATIDSGYAVGIEAPSDPSVMPVMTVNDSVWKQYIGVSDAKKAADAALAAGLTVNVTVPGGVGGGVAPGVYHGHITSVPGDITLTAG